MTHYHLDERDIMFNLKECPGLKEITKLSVFEHCDESMLDMIFEQGRAFCQKVLAPCLQTSDREGCRFEDGKVWLPECMAGLWDQYRELDLIGMNCDSAYGGAELPHFFSIPLTEMECGSFVSFSMLPLLTRGAARLIMNFGDSAQKELFLPRMFSGEWTGTMCLTEPQAGSDVGAGTTKAVREGDRYRITGSKIFISWGDHPYTQNIIHLVLARIEGAPEGSKGLSLFIVPKNRLDDRGRVREPNDVACGSIEHKMGIKASPTCVINFGTHDECVGYLLGEPQKGMRYMFQMMNEARIEVGLQGMAQASAAYLSALNYARERIQGKVDTPEGPKQAKIIEHPDVRRMLLKMRALVEGSRALLYHLVQYLDLAHHHPSEAEKYQKLVKLLTPICKSYPSDQGFRVAEMAVQTYGGYGYCQEYPVEQYLRDLKISSLYEGTNGIQAKDLVFRKILRNRGASLKIWVEDAAQLCGSLQETRLAPMAGVLTQAMKSLQQTVASLGRWAIAGAIDRVSLHATDFQEHMGHVLVGYFLLRQSATALEALEGQPGRHDRDFYEQKILTTEYFFNDFIPFALTGFEIMRREAVPGLQAEFPSPLVTDRV